MSVEAASPCENCGVEHHPDDVFCERCGYDFLTGSLPDDSAGEGHEPIRLRIVVDPDWFAVAVEAGQVELPDPVPEPTELTFTTEEIHVGRASESRNIHPDIDLATLTSDPAVSSRHAVIRRARRAPVADPTGSSSEGTSTDVWSITDAGSTNGTVVGTPTSAPLAPHLPMALEPGTSIYLGAWTRLDMA